MGYDLTGMVRYKKGFFGDLIVQVEYCYQYSESAFNVANDVEVRYAWKDATGEDLMQIDNKVPVV